MFFLGRKAFAPAFSSLGVKSSLFQYGVVMEYSAAKYLSSQDCSLYSLENLEDRHYALGFRKGIPQARILCLDNKHRLLKVPKREIFDRSDFPDFYTIKSLRVGDFGVKIKKNLKNI